MDMTTFRIGVQDCLLVSESVCARRHVSKILRWTGALRRLSEQIEVRMSERDNCCDSW